MRGYQLRGRISAVKVCHPSYEAVIHMPCLGGARAECCNYERLWIIAKKLVHCSVRHTFKIVQASIRRGTAPVEIHIRDGNDRVAEAREGHHPAKKR